MNVTAPFKTLAFRMTELVPTHLASSAAVNTLWQEDGKLCGENTDGRGLVRDLVHNLVWPVAGRRLLLLGAGGAARGLLEPLLAQQPAEIVIANRTVSRALQMRASLPEALRDKAKFLPFQELAGRDAFDMIINATSASLHNERLSLPPSVVDTGSLLYDLVYGTEPTEFQLWGREQGVAAAADGLGMLVEQAAESFFIWHLFRPETAPVLSRLREQLRASRAD